MQEYVLSFQIPLDSVCRSLVLPDFLLLEFAVLVSGSQTPVFEDFSSVHVSPDHCAPFSLSVIPIASVVCTGKMKENTSHKITNDVYLDLFHVNSM